MTDERYAITNPARNKLRNIVSKELCIMSSHLNGHKYTNAEIAFIIQCAIPTVVALKIDHGEGPYATTGITALLKYLCLLGYDCEIYICKSKNEIGEVTVLKDPDLKD